MKSAKHSLEERSFLSFEPFESVNHNPSMKSDVIRTSIDLPRDLHHRVHEAAARELILAGVERVIEEIEKTPPRRSSASIRR